MKKVKKLNIRYPNSVNEALGIARKYPHYQYWAGGTSLNSRKINDADGLIALNLIEEITHPARSEHSLELGSLMNLQEIIDLGSSTLPACLKEAIPKLAIWPLRNQATIGGNICMENSLGDLLPLLNILDTYIETRYFSTRPRRKKLVITGRKIPLSIYNGVECLHPGELVLRFIIPLKDWDFGSYEKIFYTNDKEKFIIFASLLRIEKGTVGEWKLIMSDGKKFIHRPRDLELNLSGRPFPLSTKDMEMVFQSMRKLDLLWDIQSYERETVEKLAIKFLTHPPYLDSQEYTRGITAL